MDNAVISNQLECKVQLIIFNNVIIVTYLLMQLLSTTQLKPNWNHVALLSAHYVWTIIIFSLGAYIDKHGTEGADISCQTALISR